MQWNAPPTGKRGRQQVLSDAVIRSRVSIKWSFTRTWRQNLDSVESPLCLAGLGRKVPDFSTVSRHQKTRQVRLPAKTHALDLLVYSTGVKFPDENERNLIPTDESVASVSGDGACDTKACHAAIAQRWAQAVIPPRKNVRPWKATLTGGALMRNELLRVCVKPSECIWKGRSDYHRRSLVNTKMRCLKRLYERSMACLFER